MNNFCTFFRNLSKSDKIAKKDLKNISNLAKAVVKDDLGDYAKFLVCNWPENNDPWIDFNFALRPDWVVGTPDDKQIKMRVSIDLSDNSWYVYMIVDCQDGECEDWGEKEFNSEELESCTECVRYMLKAIHGQYDKKLHEENAKSGTTRKLAGTSPEASKAPAGDFPADRIGKLEERVGELENTIRELLKK